MGVLLRLLLGLALTIGPASGLAQPAPADDAPPATDDDAQPADAAGVDAGLLSKGTLTIKIKGSTGSAIDDAAVFIDDKSMGDIEDGELTLTNIPGGRHAVAIVARGYQRFEQAMTVHEGEQARLDALLVEEPPPRSSPVWKWSLGAGVVVAAAGFSYAFYSTSKMNKNNAAVVTVVAQNPDGSGPYPFSVPLQLADCGKSSATIERQKYTTVVNIDRARSAAGHAPAHASRRRDRADGDARRRGCVADAELVGGCGR